MSPTFKILYLFFIFCSSFYPFNTTTAQNSSSSNPIYTSLSFLRFNPDSRTGALGGAGIAVSPDTEAMFHNPSKLAFAKKDIGIGLNYISTFPIKTTNPSIAYLSSYKRLDSLSSIGVSLFYYNVEITFGVPEDLQLHNFALNMSYARKLSEKMSLGLALKYAESNLARVFIVPTGEEPQKGTTVAADISLYHENPNTHFLGKKATLSWGIAISNIGNKVSFVKGSQTKGFIPTNLGLGTAIDMQMSERNNLMLALDINKLMVPTPDPNYPLAHLEKSTLSGILSSFTDAPNGLREELKELMFSFGTEYWHKQFLAIRLGYFSQHEQKGNRKLLTMGLGVKYKFLEVNFTYPILLTSNRPNDSFQLQMNLGFN